VRTVRNKQRCDRPVKPDGFIPDNEQWLHASDVASQLDAGLAWAAEHSPHATDLDQLLRLVSLHPDYDSTYQP